MSSAVISAIINCIAEPVGQWLCYPFKYNSNIENLKNQKKNLLDAKDRVQRRNDAASGNNEKLHEDVKTWLTNVGCIEEKANRILHESEGEAGTRSSIMACIACQNLKQRHQLSREAKEIVENIAELLEKGNFATVSYRPALHEMETPINMDYMAMKSRVAEVEGIMEALRSADIYKIGVWGMPGIGKSTLMKEIDRQAREEGLFNGVVVALVQKSPVIRTIQGAIASKLGLTFDQEADELGRASELHRRLSTDKKILVILDDIWKELDLLKIGIPSRGCKVVMTSRNRDVLICGMGAQKEIGLKILQKEDAWNLFEMGAGEIVRNDEVRGIAIEIVEKCAGLPIALVTVSKALKNKDISGWKDALRQLKRPAPEDVTEMLGTIYSFIELSYDSLESQGLKSLLLLCALLPCFVDYRDLLKYSYGYGLSHGIYTLEEARAALDTLLRKLKDSCLLLESSKVFYMHDLVRDVATIIASKNRNMFVVRDDGGQKAWSDVNALNRSEALSIHGGEIHTELSTMEFPQLRFFHVKGKDSLNLKILDIFFQGMDKLKVLSLRRMRLLSLFPLTNLQTLCLDGCELGDIHGIGELKTLVILSLAYSNISNLPREIESLTHLQLLDLSNCSKLRVIPPNALSSLVNLEELYMQSVEVQWEVEGSSNEGKNASLAELKKLSHLTTLEIDIPNANNLPSNLFSEKLERYKICIRDEIDAWDFMREDAFLRVLKLNLNMSFRLDVGIKMLLKRTEYLYLDEENSTKSVLYELHREDFQQLKYFHIQNNGNIKHILESGTSAVGFPILETFVLNNMLSLEEICQDKLPLSSFKNLKVLKVEYCKKLKFIFSSSIARGLSLLGELNITRCNNMRAIFVKEEEDGIEDQGDMMLFGRLQTLVLRDLPKLVGFLSTKDSFMPDCRETNSEDNHDLQLPLLRHDQVSLPSLQTLRMEGLPKIKHVWSCGQEPKTVFTGLEQLKILEISNCGVEEIVAVEGGGEVVAIRTLEFPRVTNMNFRNLRRLKWFCKGVYVSEWPMLKEMTIQGCHKVEIFASEVVSFEKVVEDQRQSEMSNIKQPLFMVDEHSFPSLETLEFWNMDSLEIIFGKLEGQNGKEPQVLISPALGTEESGATTQFASTGKLPLIYFKNLKVLKVENCQKLTFVSSSSIAKVLSLLEKLKIKRCNNMGAIVVAEDGDVILFHQLQTLVLEDLPQLVSFLSTKSSFRTDCGQIFAEGNHDLHMPLLHHQVSFPSLQRLRMKDLPKIKHVWCYDQEPRTDFRLQNLQEICAKRCESLKSLFPTSVVRCLEQLQVIEIEDCGVEEIVAVEKGGGEAVAIRTLVFPQVIELKFINLPRLKWLYKGVHVTKWPVLKEMKIERCEKVEIFASEVVSFEKTVQDQRQSELSIKQPLFSVDELEGQNGKNVVPSSVSLHNLTGLKISDCHRLINLLTSSTAKTLVQLETITVTDCKRISEIVAMEDIGEANVAITFNKLRCLELRGLPNVTHFCSGPYSFGFPSLDEVIVICCPEMKTFSHGVLSTPKLTAVYDDMNLHWKDDLNTTTRCLWEGSNQYDTRLLFRERLFHSEFVNPMVMFLSFDEVSAGRGPFIPINV
ncbi:hypothetical protein I3843_08G163400 [Carya illinoinensis]|nr:hypothetical protein I3843_08G163400 [Carya illinoinensis]